ncbi:MAG: hypothetical protein IT371_16545 [Deltaproteobacteria bacterium]|nr:hypothetical protein [Deltaproteobacteria bacterium]
MSRPALQTARRLLLLGGAACAVTFSGWGEARGQGRGRLAELTQQYAREFGLPIRTVNAGTAERRVQRQVVPVLPNTYQRFAELFSVANGALVWRSTTGDPIHATISLGGDAYLKFGYVAARQSRFAERVNQPNPSNSPQHGGYYAALALQPARVNYLLNWWATEGSDEPNFRTRHPQEPLNGGCMWWLLHARVADDVPFAHAFGVTRSRSPANLFPKLVWAGTEAVGTIGVACQSLEAFNAMGEQQLLGAPPAGGLEDAVRPAR